MAQDRPAQAAETAAQRDRESGADRSHPPRLGRSAGARRPSSTGPGGAGPAQAADSDEPEAGDGVDDEPDESELVEVPELLVAGVLEELADRLSVR